MDREALVQAIDRAFNFGTPHSIGYDCYFDVSDVRGALRALCAYAGILRTSPPRDRPAAVLVDSVEHGEVIAGCARADVVLVRRAADGQVDGDHVREILRRYRRVDGRWGSTHDVLGCFTVRSDGRQDLDEIAALFADGVNGQTFFDYSRAPDLAIDMNPMLSVEPTYVTEGIEQADSGDARVELVLSGLFATTWRGLDGEVLGYSRKIGHAWKSAVFADLRGRVPGAATHALVASKSLRSDFKRGPVWS